jgi:hypothetical protein
MMVCGGFAQRHAVVVRRAHAKVTKAIKEESAPTKHVARERRLSEPVTWWSVEDGDRRVLRDPAEGYHVPDLDARAKYKTSLEDSNGDYQVARYLSHVSSGTTEMEESASEYLRHSGRRNAIGAGEAMLVSAYFAEPARRNTRSCSFAI